MNPVDPLSDDELEELDQFLMSDATRDEAMDISMLDGFLTALAIGPVTLPPSRWMPVIWGGEASMVNWVSPEQAERITAFIFRHANSILFHLRDDPETFEPLLYEREHEGKTIPIIDEWCTGFVIGMSLDEDSWQPMIDTEQGDRLLYPILLYGTEAGLDRLRNDPTLEDRHDEFAESLGESVVAIMTWWLPYRKAKSTLRREEPKVGRNDLCPCGSGRKFKYCCGSGNKILH